MVVFGAGCMQMGPSNVQQGQLEGFPGLAWAAQHLRQTHAPPEVRGVTSQARKLKAWMSCDEMCDCARVREKAVTVRDDDSAVVRGVSYEIAMTTCGCCSQRSCST